MESAVKENSPEVPHDEVSSSLGHQRMVEGLNKKVQNQISKENVEDSDVDSGYNLINQHSLLTDMQYGISKSSDFSTEGDRHSRNIWIDSTSSSANNYVVEVGDLVVYHDPVRPTDACSCEKPEDEVQDAVFTTVARKKSVIIMVDKWTSEAVTIREVPSESQVKNESTLPDVTYAKVNKKKSANMEKGGMDSCEDVRYSMVNKVPKTKAHEDNHTNLNGFYKDMELDGSENNDIGDTADLYAEMDEDQCRNGKKTLYACVGEKVMIVNDEGDYASVKSLTDSDSSKNTEVTVTAEPLVTGNNNQSSEAENVRMQRNQYAAQYLGSVPLTQEDLSSKQCSVSVAQCITRVSQHSSQSQDKRTIYEWLKDSRMFLEIRESKQVLNLLSSDSIAVLDEHFLYSIRFWAVGQEANSKHFAYVTRNKSQKHVCRVFLCDVAAKHIASTIRNICHRLATQHLEKSKRKSVESTLLATAPEISKNGTNTNAKNEATGLLLMGSTKKNCSVTECNYIGVIKVNNSPGKDTLNSATQSVFINIPKEKWAIVDLQLSPTSITIKELANSEGKSTTLLKENVIYMGSSTKNKKLSAIFTRSGDRGTLAHVFHCEPDAENFIKQIQTVCEIRPSNKNGQSANQTQAQQKGLRTMLFGNLKGRKQGKKTDSQYQ